MDSYSGVSRVSRVGGREGDSYTTVEDQRQIIATLAKRNGITLGIEVVEEDGGSRAAKDRSLELPLRRCEEGESNGILVAYQDRLSRGSLEEQAEIWERLGASNSRLLTGDGLDSAAPGQERLFNIRAAIARDQWVCFRASRSSLRALSMTTYVGYEVALFLRGLGGVDLAEKALEFCERLLCVDLPLFKRSSVAVFVDTASKPCYGRGSVVAGN